VNLTLRPCQPPMIDHMTINKRCAVYAGVGLGKTSAVMKTLDDTSVVEDVYPALVCSTLRVARDTWIDEANKWEDFKHLRVAAAIGDPATRKKAINKHCEYYCINYENIPWLVDYMGKSWNFRTIIADESTKLRGFRLTQGTQRSHALADKAFEADRFIELSGTPTPKGLQDLWAQIYFLDHGKRLGKSFNAFQQRWFRLKFDGYGIEPLPGAQEEIMSRIKDICLSVDPADYFDLKKPIVNNVIVHLPPAALKLYKQMEKDMFLEIENNQVEAFNAASKTNKCLQLANGAIYVDDKRNYKEVHNAKIEALEDIVEETGDMPLIVAYNFVSDKERLLKHFKGSIDLSIDKNLKLFKTGKKKLGIAHPASLGHGIDGLQNVTNILVFFGHNWDLELHDQIIGRIGPVRQMQSGHNRPVFLHYIIADNTADEMVIERHSTKRDVQDILLDFMKRRKSQQ